MGQLLCRWALSQSPPMALYVGVDVGALSLVSISNLGCTGWVSEVIRIWNSSRAWRSCYFLVLERFHESTSSHLKAIVHDFCDFCAWSCNVWCWAMRSMPFDAFWGSPLWGHPVKLGMGPPMLVHESCAPLHAVAVWFTSLAGSRLEFSQKTTKSIQIIRIIPNHT